MNSSRLIFRSRPTSSLHMTDRLCVRLQTCIMHVWSLFKHCYDSIYKHDAMTCLKLAGRFRQQLRGATSWPPVDTDQHRWWALVRASRMYCPVALQRTLSLISRQQYSLAGLWHTLPTVLVAPVGARRPQQTKQSTPVIHNSAVAMPATTLRQQDACKNVQMIY